MGGLSRVVTCVVIFIQVRTGLPFAEIGILAELETKAWRSSVLAPVGWFTDIPSQICRWGTHIGPK